MHLRDADLLGDLWPGRGLVTDAVAGALEKLNKTIGPPMDDLGRFVHAQLTAATNRGVMIHSWRVMCLHCCTPGTGSPVRRSAREERSRRTVQGSHPSPVAQQADVAEGLRRRAEVPDLEDLAHALPHAYDRSWPITLITVAAGKPR
ncbi:MAG: hypothetical protein ACT4O0_11770 [Pseudonocardia sp.]